MRYISIIFASLLLGCAQGPKSSSQVKNARPDSFDKLSDEYLAGYLAWRPQTATSLGFHQYDGKITDFSKASIDAEQRRLQSFSSRLSRMTPENLSPGKRYDFQILKHAVERELFTFTKWQAYSKNPMTYAGVLDVNIYIKRDFAPLEDRVRSIIAILKQAPAIYSAARANLEKSLPKSEVETAIEEASGSADFLGKDLVEALKGVKNEPLMSEFKSANQKAIEELKAFAEYLKTEKLPAANNDFALGRERYMELIQDGEMISLNPEQLLKIGLSELKRKQTFFAETAKLIDAQKPAIEVFKEIQKDHPTEQSLIPDTTKNMEAIRQFVVDHNIITIPSPVRAQVMETPQFMRATSFASMDTPGPFEKKATEAYYYVTPVEKDWPQKQKDEWLTAFNYYTTDIVSVHEAYPGHYVQFLCLNASSATRLEKIFAGYAFTEGWAHYAEQMMVDEGFGSGASTLSQGDPVKAAKYKLAQTDEALLRICRFCVSIKMHCQGMTVDEATKFLQDNCYYEEKPAHQEAVRGSYDPEFLYYTLGKMEIFKLREDYRKQEGPKFTLQKFHDEMLRHGAPPLRLLREVMLKDKQKWDEIL